MVDLQDGRTRPSWSIRSYTNKEFVSGQSRANLRRLLCTCQALLVYLQHLCLFHIPDLHSTTMGCEQHLKMMYTPAQPLRICQQVAKHPHHCLHSTLRHHVSPTLQRPYCRYTCTGPSTRAIWSPCTCTPRRCAPKCRTTHTTRTSLCTRLQPNRVHDPIRPQ
jgi:hypothetical protein